MCEWHYPPLLSQTLKLLVLCTFDLFNWRSAVHMNVSGMSHKHMLIGVMYTVTTCLYHTPQTASIVTINNSEFLNLLELQKKKGNVCSIDNSWF